MEFSVALAQGDGIGAEITESVITIFEAAQVPVSFQSVEMGLSVFQQGISSGMTEEAKATVERLGVLLKGPMETPKGSGVKSINVTARKVWNAYANKRVFRSLAGVETPFSRADIPINITMVRENIEDTYGGIEHFLTRDVALCRRFITRPGSEQVHRYTFEMARRNGLSAVTCGHKANIMKLTDGLFLEVFYQVAKEYPEIKANDLIVDDLAMKLVRNPDQFKVIVLPNLQGDILSDLCAGLVGGLGFAPSANIGDAVAIFEAVHGTAPDIAGRGIANPTSLILSAVMMLRHLGLHGYAAMIENALLKTLELGLHTADFGARGSQALSTREFTQAIINNLGSEPSQQPVKGVNKPCAPTREPRTEHRILTSPPVAEQRVGIDVFVESTDQPSTLATKIQSVLPDDFRLTLISNRGTQVWPSGSVFTDCVDQYRIRLETTQSLDVQDAELLGVAAKIAGLMKVCSTEMLTSYNGSAGFSRAQGQ